MPNNIRLRIARKSASSVWIFDELLNRIEFKVEAREESQAAKASTSRPYCQETKIGMRIVSKKQEI